MSTDYTAAQEQYARILASLQTTPYDAVDQALSAQLKAVDDWAESIRDQPPLAAMAGVLKAQIQAAQRMLDVSKRETEQVANAMRSAAKGLGIPVGPS